jgi:aquaporin Z
MQPRLTGGFQRLITQKRGMNAQKYAAEAIGTFGLTFAGCGSAIIAAAFPQVGIGLVGVSLTF